jgi:hypothetical protein
LKLPPVVVELMGLTEDSWVSGGEIDFKHAFAAAALGDSEFHLYVMTELLGSGDTFGGPVRRLRQQADGLRVRVMLELPAVLATETMPVLINPDLLQSSSFSTSLLAELQLANDLIFSGVQVFVQSRPCDGLDCEPGQPGIEMLVLQAIQYCTEVGDGIFDEQLNQTLIERKDELEELFDLEAGVDSVLVNDFLESLFIDMPAGGDVGDCVVDYVDSMMCSMSGDIDCPPPPRPPGIPPDSAPDATVHVMLSIQHCSMGMLTGAQMQRVNDTLQSRVSDVEGLIQQEVRMSPHSKIIRQLLHVMCSCHRLC